MLSIHYIISLGNAAKGLIRITTLEYSHIKCRGSKETVLTQLSSFYLHCINIKFGDSKVRKKVKQEINELPSNLKETTKKTGDEKDIVSEIAVAAYYKAQARGYEPGHEIQDWIEAEAEILKQK